MIPVLDYAAALVQRLEPLSLKHLKSISRKHAEHRQEFLTRLLVSSFERRYPHRDDRSKDAFGRDFLAVGLRSKERYQAFLEPLYKFPKGSKGYSASRHLTKPYRLREAAYEALWEVHGSESPLPVTWRSTEGQEAYSKAPSNGLPEPVANLFQLPAVLKVDLEAVTRSITRVEESFGMGLRYPEDPLSESKPHGVTWGDALQMLYAAKKQIVSLGGIPNLYEEQSHGRLGPRAGAFHLIRLPNTVRRLLYMGSEMKDYDIQSCFWSIFVSLGQELGFKTDRVENYLFGKRFWHDRWATYTAHPYRDTFKAVALSWLTGGNLSPHWKNSATRQIGADAMRFLGTDPITLGLYDEVKVGMRRVVEECGSRERDGGDVVLTNSVGARLRLKNGRRDRSQEAMHLLAGYEQFAIREACKKVPNLQAIIYDGFVAPSMSVEVLEETIRERSSQELGLTLNLEIKTEDLSDPLQCS